MPRTGRPPKPAPLKDLLGNPGKRRVPPEPQPARDMPPCPPHLSDKAKLEWGRLAPELHRLGLLTSVDGHAFAAYCQAYARWVDAELGIQKLAAEDPNSAGGTVATGASGSAVVNPMVRVAAQAWEAMDRFGRQFGLSPVARAAVGAAIVKGGAALPSGNVKPERKKAANDGASQFFGD